MPSRTITVALIAGAIAAFPATGLAMPDRPAAVERHRAADAALQASSAELALLRTRARALAGAALDANLRRQSQVERRKQRLLRTEATHRVAAERALEHRRTVLHSARRRAAAAPHSPVAGLSGDAHGDDPALAATIDAYLASKSSPLVGEGATFVRASRAVGLDPRFLVAIAGAETSFGTYGPSQAIHNPFGMGPGIVYGSWAESIEGAARNLGGSLYLGDGRVTIAAIHQRWAPVGASNDPGGLNGSWPRNVTHYLVELGGDPTRPVFGPVAPAGAVPDTVPARAEVAGVSPTRESTAGTGTVTPPPPPAREPVVGRVFAQPVAFGPMLDAAAPNTRATDITNDASPGPPPARR